MARLGGDEFVAVLTRCPARLAAERARTIEAALTHLGVRHGDRIFPVSASCGHAAFGPDSDRHDLMRRADRAMYGIKADKRRHSG